MRTSLFDFELPPERIALRPISPRDAARLLVVRPRAPTEFDDRGVRDLPDLLRPGDALVVNDTKVIAARLSGRRIGHLGLISPATQKQFDLDIPLARPLAGEPGVIQQLTPSIEALVVPNIDDALDEEAAKRAFWSSFKVLGEWYADLPPY